jgi:hypothetical protein
MGFEFRRAILCATETDKTKLPVATAQIDGGFENIIGTHLLL